MLRFKPKIQRPRWRSDLWLVSAATLGSFVLGSAFEWHEWLAQRLAHLERWQADEIPLTLTMLACGLAWYALRRRREAQAQLILREQAEARISELLLRNRELVQGLITLQESERQTLARELHDEFGQSCTAIRVETACLRHCAVGDTNGMLAAAERADAAAQSLTQLVRDMLRRLRPANLDSLGLAAALQEHCRAWQERTAVQCSFRTEGNTEALGDTIDITLYRIVQEALTNVARHARAGSVRVELLRLSPQELSLSVQDDGRGMDLAQATRGLGLLGAVERAAAVGGKLEIISAPGAGLAIRLHIVLPAPAQVFDAALAARIATTSIAVAEAQAA